MSEETLTQKYTAPPIIEAITQVVFVESLSEAKLKKAAKRIGREYDSAVSQKSVEAKLDFPNEQAIFRATPQTKLSSKDETDVLLIQSKAFTWKRLAPYLGWEIFEQRIVRDLTIFFDLFGPRKIARMGVRYINRLDIPGTEPVTRYEDYLTINLSLPDDWPVNQYSWRFDRNFSNGLFAIVQSAIVLPEVPHTIAIALDIDVIAREELPIKFEEVIAKLKKMRTLKNEIFETIVTDLAKESFFNAT